MSQHSLPLPDGWQLTATPGAPLRQLAVDPALLLHGRMVSAARLPLEPVTRTALKPGSSSLLLGAAIVLLADAVPPEDQAALLDFARQLRFHPENFRKSRPVLGEASLDAACIAGLIFRDGHGQRACFCGDPAALLSCCSMIWDDQPRPVVSGDLSRIAAEPCSYGYATAEVTADGMGDIIYLGSLTVADAPNEPILAALRRLESDGFSIRPLEHGAALSADTLAVSAVPTDGPCLIPPVPDDGRLYEAVTASARQAEHHLMLQAQKRQRLLRRRITACLLGALPILAGILFLFLIHTAPAAVVPMAFFPLAAAALRLRRSRMAVLLWIAAAACLPVLAMLPLPAAAFSLVCGMLSAVISWACSPESP